MIMPFIFNIRRGSTLRRRQIITRRRHIATAFVTTYRPQKFSYTFINFFIVVKFHLHLCFLSGKRLALVILFFHLKQPLIAPTKTLLRRRCPSICRQHKTNKNKRDAFHRSISPNTTSSVPMMAETSASMWPLDIKSNPCRCAKPGARTLQR